MKEFNEEEFLRFAKAYLSEAFPNPEGIDCPRDSELWSMAEHPLEGDHAFTSNHITLCSPCFNRYMEILGDLKRRKAG